MDSLGMPSAKYQVVLHRVLKCSLPEDSPILYRKHTKMDTIRADSAAVSREDQVKAILKFLEVEVERREKSCVL